MTDPTLLFLEQVRDNLDYVDYDLIYKSIEDLKDKMLPTSMLKKDHFIDRVRINKEDEVFTSIDDISYISDIEVLKNNVEFGRANKPHQPVFYGSIISPQINIPRAVAYLETSKKVSEIRNLKNIHEVFTLSRWRVLDDLEIIEMIFCDEAIKKNNYAKESFNSQLKNFIHLPLRSHYEKQGIFFSNEFARNDIRNNESFKYKISAAYINYIWEKTPFKGITYPSVASEYRGQNVALLPSIVDTFLKLEVVAMFRFDRINGVNKEIPCIKIAIDLGKDQKDFNWVEYNPLSALSSDKYFN